MPNGEVVVRTWITLTLLAGCSADATPLDSDAPVAPAADTDPAPDSPADNDTEEAVDTDVEPAEPQVLHFIVFGDGGTGSEAQYAVASGVQSVCAVRGCDFAVYLGENIYDSGVTGVDDPQFEDKFEKPYANLNFPFWVVLGNHDYGGNGLGFEGFKADYEVAYTERSAKWTMPERFYTFVEQHVQFVALDTNAILWDNAEDQAAWIGGALREGAPAWRIALGHHPYLSNGKHGNAGTYDDLEWLPIANGKNFQTFFEDHLCGNVDMYLSGHDHNRQWLEPKCDTEYIVSGAAAKLSEDKQRGNPSYFEDYDHEGFVWVEIRDNQFTGAFYDRDGNLEYDRTFTR